MARQTNDGEPTDGPKIQDKTTETEIRPPDHFTSAASSQLSPGDAPSLTGNQLSEDGTDSVEETLSKRNFPSQKAF